MKYWSVTQVQQGDEQMPFSINMMVDKDCIHMEIQEHDGQRWQEKLREVSLPIALAKDVHAALGKAIEKATQEAVTA